jgi:hypothetical protein
VRILDVRAEAVTASGAVIAGGGRTGAALVGGGVIYRLRCRLEVKAAKGLAAGAHAVTVTFPQAEAVARMIGASPVKAPAVKVTLNLAAPAKGEPVLGADTHARVRVLGLLLWGLGIGAAALVVVRLLMLVAAASPRPETPPAPPILARHDSTIVMA